MLRLAALAHRASLTETHVLSGPLGGENNDLHTHVVVVSILDPGVREKNDTSHRKIHPVCHCMS